LRLDEVEALLASRTLVVDACRYCVHRGDTTIALATRPLLFTLACMLAKACPEEVPRDVLVAGAFRLRHVDESARARLRVEMGRLRKVLRPVAGVQTTPGGFALAPRDPVGVVVLAGPVEERHAEVLAMLADGESWSSSALALALGVSQRNLQRALETLAAEGKVHAFGRGRARRWMAPPVTGFTTVLLLPTPLPGE
ncbi:MAG: helix-turn-helix domain-containing protein, partial [Proteobacteria bacterium]|nr:helix-turn-helix domain-containing protein [Pseudomonadota bacterium]